jgi:hypothetical protein
LKKDDTIVIGGSQRLQARMKIQPELIAMPIKWRGPSRSSGMWEGSKRCLPR